jgi:hypothetical protein
MSASSKHRQRGLSRAQVQEILERNAQLYRSENHFVSYFIDLAIYLLECEYDWADASLPPPEHVRARQAAATPPPADASAKQS